MTALALTLGITAILAWCATLGTVIYGLIAKHAYIEGMFFALAVITFAAGFALAGAFTALGCHTQP